MKMAPKFWPGLAVAAAGCLILAACGNDPVSTSSTDNPNVPVSKMFEFEGCKVYRFKDAGAFVYYSNCPGSTTAFHSESCGKGCTKEVPIGVTTRSNP